MKLTTYHVCISRDDFNQQKSNRRYGQETLTLMDESRDFPRDNNVIEVFLSSWAEIDCIDESVAGIRRADVSRGYEIDRKRVFIYRRTKETARIEVPD